MRLWALAEGRPAASVAGRPGRRGAVAHGVGVAAARGTIGAADPEAGAAPVHAPGARVITGTPLPAGATIRRENRSG